MKPLINKAASLVTGTVLFALSCVMAGLGLAVMSVLALFALSVVGLALLAAPFVASAQNGESDTADTTATA